MEEEFGGLSIVFKLFVESFSPVNTPSPVLLFTTSPIRAWDIQRCAFTRLGLQSWTNKKTAAAQIVAVTGLKT